MKVITTLKVPMINGEPDWFRAHDIRQFVDEEGKGDLEMMEIPIDRCKGCKYEDVNILDYPCNSCEEKVYMTQFRPKGEKGVKKDGISE